LAAGFGAYRKRKANPCPDVAPLFVIHHEGSTQLQKGSGIMGTQTKSKPKASADTAKANVLAHNVVWFEVAADDIERAKAFYGSLFGWKIEKFPGDMDYWHIATGSEDRMKDGGMMKRKHPGQGITNYVGVASVDKFVAKVEKLGGKVCLAKTAVPHMGYFAVCADTENNVFGLWETDENAE
jgi:predicted enzyme related to lactoylglutathione lyase